MEYRIFDKEEKEYCEEPDYRWMLSRKGKLYNSENDKWHNVGERFIIERYTGKLDKNGVKIFEGDWLKIEALIDQEYGKPILFEGIKQVIWSNTNTICLESKQEQEWIKQGSNHYKYCDTSTDNIYFLSCLESFEMEIIDNPELLEQPLS